MQATGKITKGIDVPVDQKKSTSAETYFHHDASKHDKVSQVVGVQRGQDCYKKVSETALFDRPSKQEMKFKSTNFVTYLARLGRCPLPVLWY